VSERVRLTPPPQTWLPECSYAPECCYAAADRPSGLHPEHWLKRLHLVYRLDGLDPFDRIRGLDLVDRLGRLAGVGTFRRLAWQRRVGHVGAVVLVHPRLALKAGDVTP
jgi:hypothetical protein